MAPDLQAQLRLAGLPAPVTECRFHPTRLWRWDLSWPAYKVAFEQQGAVYRSGRHTRGRGYEADCLKAAEGQLLGWLVVWCSTGQVRDGTALGLLERALRTRGWVP
jgi:hypothetical protein